jgi:hypothetical protein
MIDDEQTMRLFEAGSLSAEQVLSLYRTEGRSVPSELEQMIRSSEVNEATSSKINSDDIRMSFLDWGWYKDVTRLTSPPIEEGPPGPLSQEADGDVSLAFEPAPVPNEDWSMFLSGLENTGFPEPLEAAADSVFAPMEHDALWGGLLTTNLDLFDPDTNIAGGQDWWDQFLAQNPVPDETLSLDRIDQPNTAFGLEEITRKRTARQEDDSETESSAAKRPRPNSPWYEGPAIGAQPMTGPFGDVHIQAPEPQEPVLLSKEEWLREEHVDAGMGYLAAQLRRGNSELANRVRFVSVQAGSQLQNLGEEFGEYLGALRSHLLYGEAGEDTARYLFLPINNGVHFGGSHWSLLFLDLSDPEMPRGYHYDSLPGPGLGQLSIAAGLAGRLGVGAEYFDGHMADQDNGYDCGIAMLAATQEMIDRISQGRPCDDATLDLSSVEIDRSAVQGWLEKPQGSHDEVGTDQDIPDAAEAERSSEYDLFGTPIPSRATTPGLALPGSQSVQMPMANSFSQTEADPSLESSTHPAARRRITGTRRLQQQERALPDQIADAVSAGLDAIETDSAQKETHVRLMREQFLSQWPIRLQEHSSDTQAAISATLSDLPRRVLHDSVYEIIANAIIPFMATAAVQAEMTSLGLTDAADRKLKGGKKHAKALKEKHPTLSIATAAWLSGATEGHLRQDPAFQDEAGSAVQAEMTRLGLTDAADRKLKGGAKHAKALKEKHPTLSIATAAWLSGATEGTLRQDPAFQDEAGSAVQAEMTRLGLTDAADRKLKGGKKHAKALKEKHPTLSIATAAWLSGATESDLRQDPAFQDEAGSAVQAEMTSLGLTDAADRKLKGGAKHAKALKEKHPTLSIATAAWLSGATEANLRQDPAFQDEAGSAVQAEMTRLGLTDAADRKLKGGAKHAKALKEKHPTLSIATAAWLSGATESDLRQDPAFQDEAGSAVQAEMTSLGLTDAADRKLKGGKKHAKALKEKHPTLSIATAAWLSGATEANLRKEPAFQDEAGSAVQAEMTRLGLTDAADRKLKGGLKHAKALKEKHPTLSIATAAWLSGATEANLRKEPAFQDEAGSAVQAEMTRLGLTDAADRKLKGGKKHAKALKEKHPTLSIATAAWLSGATESDLRKEPAFQDEAGSAVQAEMTSLGLTDAADRKLKGGKKHAKALKEKHPTLSIATAAWLSGATEGHLRQDPAFQDEAGSAVQAEMTRLGLTDAADRKLKGGLKHAKALKEKHPTLSIATAAWLSGATEANLRQDPAFQDEAGSAVQAEMTRLGLTDAADRKLKGGKKHAKALKEKHPTLSIATAAWLSGATEGHLRQDPAFQ